MWTWMLAADAANSAGIDPTAAFLALVAAAGGILGSAFGFMLALSRNANERVDAVSRDQLEHMKTELQTEKGETLAAEKDRDLWHQKCTQHEIENATLRAEVATLKAENRRLKQAP